MQNIKYAYFSSENVHFNEQILWGVNDLKKETLNLGLTHKE